MLVFADDLFESLQCGLQLGTLGAFVVQLLGEEMLVVLHLTEKTKDKTHLIEATNPVIYARKCSANIKPGMSVLS